VNHFRSFYKPFKCDGSFLHCTAHTPNYQLTILQYELLSLINNAISQSIDQLSVPDVSYKPLTCSVPWAQFCLSDIQWRSGKI